MTRQALARLKLKAFNAGKLSVIRGEKPKLPDCKNLSLSELEVLLNAMQAGQLAGMRKLALNQYGRFVKDKGDAL